MAFEKIGLSQGFTAASDLSAASMQFCLVKLTATGVCLCTANTDAAIGVLQNSPTRGQLADVMLEGISKVRVNAADITLGALIAPDSTSRAIALTSATSVGFRPAGVVVQVDVADNDGALVSAYIKPSVGSNA